MPTSKSSPGHSFGRRVLLLAGGTAIGQALVIGASPLLTRIYTPEDFGLLGAYVAVLSLFVAVASLRYHLAIPLPAEERDGFALLLVSLACVAVVSLLLFLVLSLFAAHVLSLLGAADLINHSWILAFGVLGAGSYQALTYWAIRRQAFRPLAATKITQGVVLTISQIGLGLLTAGPFGLLLGDALGRSAGTGVLARLSFKGAMSRARTNWTNIRALLVRYRRFPTYSTLSALLNTGGLQLPAILILSFYGPQVAGWYALTMRVLGIPMSLIGTSASHVFTSSIAEKARLGQSSASFYARTALRLLLIGLPIAALIAVLGPQAFAFVFSSEWSQAGTYARILAPMFLVQFVASPLSQTINVLERQDIQFAWDAGRLVLVVGSLLLANGLGWSPTTAIGAMSSALALAYIALVLISWRLAAATRKGSKHSERS